MADNKKEVNVHIIHSMKGGCGKSTCALFKAIQIAFNEGIDDKRAKVLFIDADFKGSAMKKLLFERDSAEETGNSKNERMPKIGEIEKDVQDYSRRAKVEEGVGQYHSLAIPNDFENHITLSDYLRDSSKYSIQDVICHSCSYTTIGKAEEGSPKESDEDSGQRKLNSKLGLKQPYYINGYIDFMLSSTSAESKDWFRYKEGKIPAGVYRWRMDTIIRNILKIGSVNDEAAGTYTDIVVDMPPGYDEYSDILLELLRKNAQKEDKLKLHYYAVTTEDIGHTTLTKNNIKKLIADNAKYKSFASINIILNAVSIEEFKALEDNQKKDYRNWLKLDNALKGSLYLNENSASYHKFCRTRKEEGFEQDISKVIKEI
ncbi:MAG: hypothetical protein NC313_04065 [Butyrivibrio sp.]|nr:hypothetical protein [Butyrivibrio sp.]